VGADRGLRETAIAFLGIDGWSSSHRSSSATIFVNYQLTELRQPIAPTQAIATFDVELVIRTIASSAGRRRSSCRRFH
jgi:hypothetical protein